MNAITPSTRAITSLLTERTGQQITASRSWKIDSALIGLYREHGIGSMDELALLLRRWPDSSLSDQVVDALLNNETYFFRDKLLFDTLLSQVLTDAAERRKQQKRLSIWSAGCSTGQEAYSLAMAIAENPARWAGWTIDILGTDVSVKAVEAAREGYYTSFQVQRGLGITQMLRWFEESDGGWTATSELKRMVRFETQNILDPMPFYRKFDIVLCRNVLLYFDAETRAKTFERIASSMVPEGWLMLGAGESVVGQAVQFSPDQNLPNFFRLNKDRTAESAR